MVIDFGTIRTIQVWRKVFNHLIDGPNIRGRYCGLADVAGILTPDNVTVVQYCKDPRLDCEVSERAFLEACKSGNTEILDWFVALETNLYELGHAAEIAAAKCCVCVLEWSDKQTMIPHRIESNRAGSCSRRPCGRGMSLSRNGSCADLKPIPPKSAPRRYSSQFCKSTLKRPSSQRG
ncbi:hypothetical protein BCR44DRAFT_1433394 [Catenaria anguillulae PL171]|uniref:Uncharacterized protein n=1 Tax=Catenaria anguillulae PL171 TaxID=765915 RepID=A0A1Y2HNB8_9FUNG|nr:hypothetical protein BCR44DRAFT_1433394 [Catenaria anguillulae PL171]